MESNRESSEGDFVRKTLIVVAIVALAAALYRLSDVVLLGFGAVIVSIVLRAIARPIDSSTPIGQRVAVLIAAVIIAGLIGLAGYLFGAKVSEQLSLLLKALPDAVHQLTRNLPVGDIAGSSFGSLVVSVFSWGTTLFGAAAAFIVMVITGIYLAVNPSTYRAGFLMLFPVARQAQISETLEASAEALLVWIKAQLIAMIIVGSLVAVALAMIGVPSPLALGLLAGLLEFVPVLGPVVAAVPALLIAATQDWHLAVWTLGVFVIVQQVESSIITPLIVGRAAGIAPAVGLLAVVATGLLFGPLGVLLGYPIAVVADIAVRKLYVRETLGEDVEIKSESVK